MSVLLELPIPQTFLQAVWMGVGLTFGRAFGKDLDYNVQQSDWFKNRNYLIQLFLKRLMDFLHHWYMGALLMIYFSELEVYWFGFGLLIDDLPDIPSRIKKFVRWGGTVVG